jgi:ankyrin repeat protein
MCWTQGRRPLCNAAERGNINIVKLLIDYDADPKHTDAIKLAIYNNHIDVAEYLIKHGVSSYFDPEIFIYHMSQNESMVETVEFFVKYYKENSNETSETDFYNEILGEAFIVAAKTGSLETVVALVEAGIDIDKYKKPALLG